MVAAACMRGSFLREAPSIILQFGSDNFVFSIDDCLWGRLYGGSTVFSKIIGPFIRGKIRRELSV